MQHVIGCDSLNILSYISERDKEPLRIYCDLRGVPLVIVNALNTQSAFCKSVRRCGIALEMLPRR